MLFRSPPPPLEREIEDGSNIGIGLVGARHRNAAERLGKRVRPSRRRQQRDAIPIAREPPGGPGPHAAAGADDDCDAVGGGGRRVARCFRSAHCAIVLINMTAIDFNEVISSGQSAPSTDRRVFRIPLAGHVVRTVPHPLPYRRVASKIPVVLMP